MSAVESAPPEAASIAYAAACAHGLYERQAATVLRYCRRLLDSREEAEDALQTTFTQAFGALRRGAAPTAERAWLLAIARNVCNDHWRRSRGRRFQEVGGDPAVLEDIVAADEHDRDELIPLRAALETLTGQQRRAILLREWQGLSYREIADDLGISQSAVETLIFRARRALAQALESEKTSPRCGALAIFNLDSLVGAVKSVLPAGAVAAKVAVATAVATTVVAVGPAVGRKDSAPPSSSSPSAERAVPRPASVRIAPEPRSMKHLRRQDAAAATMTSRPAAQQETAPAADEGESVGLSDAPEPEISTVGAVVENGVATVDTVTEVATGVADGAVEVVEERTPAVGVPPVPGIDL